MKYNNYKINGEVLKNLLHEKNIAIYKCAKDTGISTFSISNYIKGRYKTPIHKVIILAKYLNVNMLDLIDEESQHQPIVYKQIPKKQLSKKEKNYNKNILMINRIIHNKKTNQIDLIVNLILNNEAIRKQTSFETEKSINKFIEKNYKNICWIEGDA